MMPEGEESTLAASDRRVAGFCQDSGRLVTLLELSPARVRKTLIHKHQGMEPMAGIEPATDGLRNRCSTTELHWRPKA